MVNGQKLSVAEKVGYGLGDSAANFIFQTMLVFQLSFYTDTFGLTAAAAGTLFLLVRFFDAFFDPLMGILSDRTNTRWGKFRPWVIATAIPFGIMGFITFTTPHLGATGKLIYAYCTYIGLMMVYSANNLPYSALSGVMTSDIGERTSLSSYRFVCAMSAAFVIQSIAPMMLKHFSGGNTYTPAGYQITMGIFSVLCVVFFIITFATTKERIHPRPDQRSSVIQDLKDLVRNGPWIALFLLTIFVFITLSMHGGVMLFYFKYNVGNDDLFKWFNAVGLGANIIGILFSRGLSLRFGKREVFIVGLAVTTLLTAVFGWLPAKNIPLVFGTEGVRMFFYGLTIPLLWAMMADVADYSEWKTGRRATGIVFSAVVFGLKAGLGIGGAIAGWLLSSYGYVANVEQTPRALEGIRLTAGVYSAIPFLIGVICLFFYGINKQLNIQITDELAERRKAFEPPPPLADTGILAEAP